MKSARSNHHSDNAHSDSDRTESHEAFYRKMQQRLHRIRKGIEDLSSKRALVKSTRRGADGSGDLLERRAFHFEETAQGDFRLSLN